MYESNYILMIDENGSPYLAHAWLKKGEQKKDHKYVVRVPGDNGKYIYFYSQRDYDIWKNHGRRTLRNRIQDRLGWDERSARNDAAENLNKLKSSGKATASQINAANKSLEDAEAAYKRTAVGLTETVKKYGKTKLSEVRSNIDNIGIDEAYRYYKHRNDKDASAEDKEKYKKEYEDTKIGQVDFGIKEKHFQKDMDYIKDRAAKLVEATNDYNLAKTYREQMEKELAESGISMFTNEYLYASNYIHKLKLEEREKEYLMNRAERKFNKSKAAKMAAEYGLDSIEKIIDLAQTSNDDLYDMYGNESLTRGMPEMLNSVKATQAVNAINNLVSNLSNQNAKTFIGKKTKEALADYLVDHFAIPVSQADAIVDKAFEKAEDLTITVSNAGRKKAKDIIDFELGAARHKASVVTNKIKNLSKQAINFLDDHDIGISELVTLIAKDNKLSSEEKQALWEQVLDDVERNTKRLKQKNNTNNASSNESRTITRPTGRKKNITGSANGITLRDRVDTNGPIEDIRYNF